MARLLLIDSGSVQEIQMGQELTIGRAYSNLLRLEGDEVSRVHAIVYRRGKDYILRDLDSKNGLLLNGEKVGNALLVPSDTIQLGKYTLVFDPPADFKVDALVKPESTETPPSGIADDADEGELESGEAASVYFYGSKESQPDIVFDPAEIEAMQDSHVTFTPQMLPSVLRMLGRLASATGVRKLSPEARARLFLAAAMSAVGAQRGVLALKGGSGEELRSAAIEPADKDLALNRVVLGAVLKSRQAVLCNNPQEDPRFKATETIAREGITALIAFPLLRDDGSAAGLVYCDTTSPEGEFRREHLIILYFVARLALLAGLGELTAK